jgi:hypothetical protein
LGCSPAKQQATDPSPESKVVEATPDAKGCLNPPKDMDGPAGAVYHFLAAFRSGDDTTAEAMLTELSRKQIKEHKLVVAPPANDSVQFEIGDVEMLGDNGARVKAQWSDIKDGKRFTDETTWMLRKEAAGWRVAGMAAIVFPGEPSILLDFENLEETQAKRAKLKEEIARRNAQNRNGATETAQDSGTSAATSGAESSVAEAVAEQQSPATPADQPDANAKGVTAPADSQPMTPEQRTDFPPNGQKVPANESPPNNADSSAPQQVEKPADATIR